MTKEELEQFKKELRLKEKQKEDETLQDFEFRMQIAINMEHKRLIAREKMKDNEKVIRQYGIKRKADR